MIYPAEGDIVPLVKGLVLGLQPYAAANQIRITFSTNTENHTVQYQPFALLQSLGQLICSIINLVPPQSDVQIRLQTCAEKEQLYVEVENTGINLIRVNSMNPSGLYPFSTYPLDNGTLYRLAIPLQVTGSFSQRLHENGTPGNNLPV